MFRVLILDDDEHMLRKHKKYLKDAPFECLTTQYAKEAIERTINDPSIQFVLVDQILFIPPIPSTKEEGELQQWQGEGVVREINSTRPDVRFIFVTAAPMKESDNGGDAIVREEFRLKNHRGVIDLIHRIQIEDQPESAYQRILNLIGDGKVQSSFRPEANPEGHNMTDIETDMKIVTCALSVCRARIPKFVNGKIDREKTSSGTGWLIAPTLVLTCWHVIEARSFYELSISEKDLKQQIENGLFTFKHTKLGAGITYSIAKLEHDNSSLDYALLRLQDREDESIHEFSYLSVDVYAPITMQSRFLVLQHPGGKSQKRSEGWYIEKSIDGNCIFHTAPSEGGTSGAPVIDSENFSVIAIHNGEDRVKEARKATLIKAILSDLKEQNPSIYVEIIEAQRERRT